MVRRNIKKVLGESVRLMSIKKFTKVFKSSLSSPRYEKLKENALVRVASLGFVLALIIPGLFTPSLVAAYGQVQSRSIELSSSAASATSVQYTVQFNVATTGNIEAVVVDFCSNDPIIGDSCTAPAAPFAVGGTVVANNTGLNPTASSSWTPSAINSGRTFEFTDGTGGSVSSGTTITIIMSGNTNPPTPVGTFYARIFTFSSTSSPGLTDWTGLANGSDTTGVVDAGGIAISTVNQITITSKVQEQITFCVYTASLDSGNCGAATGTSIQLGNTKGVLSTTGPYVDYTTNYDIQSNALHGVTIRFTGTTLTSGSNVIAADPGVSGTNSAGPDTGSAQSTTASPQFGLCSFPDTGGTPTNLTIAATYSGASSGTYNGTQAGSTCYSQTEGAGAQSSGTNTPGDVGTAYFGLDLDGTVGIQSTYGDTLATYTAGQFSQGSMAFVGNISNTNVAGIYTATLTFIATGKY